MRSPKSQGATGILLRKIRKQILHLRTIGGEQWTIKRSEGWVSQASRDLDRGNRAIVML